MTPYEQWIVDRWDNHSRAGVSAAPVQRDLCIMGLGIGGEAGEVQELIKKYIRDGKHPGDKLLLELGDVIHYAIRIGQHFGYSLADITAANRMKLEARDRGERVG